MFSLDCWGERCGRCVVSRGFWELCCAVRRERVERKEWSALKFEFGWLAEKGKKFNGN